MFNKEEEKLEAMKKDYMNLDIPENIDDFIYKGINKGKEQKSKRKFKKITGYAASFLLVIMLISIRVSPAFAEMMSNIPGVEYIVKLINYDKGLQLAVENEFMQHVGASDEHEGIVFTVEDIIVDESQMIVFYSIENHSDYENIRLSSIKFLNEEGNSLKASYGWSPAGDEGLVDGKEVGKVSVSFGLETTIPDEVTVNVKLSESISRDEMNKPSRVGESSHKPDSIDLEATWEVKVPIDKEKFENLKETYLVNQEIMFGNQKIYFKEITLHPTRVVLDIEYDENNTKKIFGFENLRLIDENSQWAAVSNGIIATHPSENSIRLYLESNYFTKPESIYIAADGVRVLDKDKLDIKIDLQKGQMLNPPDEKLRLIEVTTHKAINDEGNLMEVVFEVDSEEANKSNMSFAWEFKDGTGTKYSSKGIGSHSVDGEKDRIYYSISDNPSYSNPITLSIQDYPNVIRKNVRIKVK